MMSQMMMMMMITMGRIVTVDNLADKVHADGHARGEEQTQLLKETRIYWSFLKVLERSLQFLTVQEGSRKFNKVHDFKVSRLLIF